MSYQFGDRDDSSKSPSQRNLGTYYQYGDPRDDPKSPRHKKLVRNLTKLSGAGGPDMMSYQTNLAIAQGKVGDVYAEKARKIANVNYELSRLHLNRPRDRQPTHKEIQTAREKALKRINAEYRDKIIEAEIMLQEAINSDRPDRSEFPPGGPTARAAAGGGGPAAGGGGPAAGGGSSKAPEVKLSPMFDAVDMLTKDLDATKSKPSKVSRKLQATLRKAREALELELGDKFTMNDVIDIAIKDHDAYTARNSKPNK